MKFENEDSTVFWLPENISSVFLLLQFQSLDLFINAASAPPKVVPKPIPTTYGGVTADEFYDVIEDIVYHFISQTLLVGDIFDHFQKWYSSWKMDSRTT